LYGDKQDSSQKYQVNIYSI